MFNKWEDATTYRQSETERTPRCWRTTAGGLTIKVHRHVDWPGKWLLTTYPDIFSKEPLREPDIFHAKEESILRVKKALQKILKEL